MPSSGSGAGMDPDKLTVRFFTFYWALLRTVSNLLNLCVIKGKRVLCEMQSIRWPAHADNLIRQTRGLRDW